MLETLVGNLSALTKQLTWLFGHHARHEQVDGAACLLLSCHSNKAACMNCNSLHRPLVIALLVNLMALTACGPESTQELVAKGKADLSSGNARSAVVRFKSALQAEPNATGTRVLLGQALVDAADPLGAIVELSKSLDQRADTSAVMPALARAMLATGQSRQLLETHGQLNLLDNAAQAAFKTQLAVAASFVGDRAKVEGYIAQALAAVPEYPGALIVQARAMLLRKEFEASLTTAERAIVLDPKLAPAWHLKGEALLAGKGDRAAGESAIRKALEIDPRYGPAHSALVASRIAAGDLDGAKKQLAAFKAAVPSSPEAVFLGAQVSYIDKDYAKAKEGTQLLLRIAPEHPAVLQLAAAVEWQVGSLVIARKMLETAIRVEPTLEGARVNLANVSILLGQPARGLAALDTLLKAGTTDPSALAAAGEASLRLGQTAAAEDFYSRAAKAAPDNQRTGTAFAMSQLANGDSTAGFARLESMASKNADGYVDAALASARLNRREYDAALAAVDSLIKKTPASAGAHELRGRVLLAKGDRVGARSAFEKSITLEPRFVPGVTSLAEMDLGDGKPEQARTRTEAFLKADPGNHVAAASLADLRIQAGVPAKEVQATLAEAIRLAPDEAGPRLKLIDVLARQKQVKNAVAAAQEAAAVLPNDVQVLDALGRAHFSDGNTQQALVTFNRVVSIDPNLAVAHLRIANTHTSEGNRSAAVASLRRALEIDPKLREARQQIVNLLVDLKRPKEALEIAVEMQRRDPKSSAGYLLEGAILRKLGNHAGAAAVYRKGLDATGEPGDLPLNLFVSLLAGKNWKQAETFGLSWLAKHPDDGAVVYNLAEGYMMNRDYGSAEVYFSKAVALRPDHVPSLNNLAAMLLSNGKPGGLELAKRAVQLAPDNTAALDTLAGALAVDKQWAEALRAQQKAVAIAPNDPVLRLNLAKIALRSGDKALAKAELDRLLALGGRNPLQAEAIRLLKEI